MTEVQDNLENLAKKQNKMLVFLVCGLTLLFTPNGKFEDHYVSPARGSFWKTKLIRDHHHKYLGGDV